MSKKGKNLQHNNFLQDGNGMPITLSEVHPIIKATRRSLPDGASLLLRMHKLSDICVNKLRDILRKKHLHGQEQAEYSNPARRRERH